LNTTLTPFIHHTPRAVIHLGTRVAGFYLCRKKAKFDILKIHLFLFFKKNIPISKIHRISLSFALLMF